MHFRYLFLSGCLFFYIGCFAQQYPFVYYTPKEGLINSRVRIIKQDNKGRMYFLTYGGLSVYDGTRFSNYNLQTGLAHDVVNDVVEIAPDSMLVATNTQQLNTLVHGKAGIFKTSDNFCPVINQFLKSSDGNWYVTADEGLFLFANKKFTNLSFSYNGADAGKALSRIIEWKNYFLIIPWDDKVTAKLILYDRVKKAVADVFDSYFVSDITSNNEKEILAATPEGIKQIDLSSLENGKIKFQEFTSLDVKLAGRHFTYIFIDAQKNYWFYNGNEILLVSPALNTRYISREQGLKAGSLIHIFQDREGTIWMATNGSGVIKMTGTQIQLINNFLPGDATFISSICQQNDSLWLFNAAKKCLYRIVKDEIVSFPLKTNLNAANIYVISNHLYINDGSKIIYIHDKNDEKSYLHQQIIIPDSGYILGNGITDKYGAIIQPARKHDSAFLVVIKANKILIRHKIDFMADQLALDNNGRLWVATRSNHLMVFNINPESPEYLQLIKNFHDELPAMDPRSLTTGKDNTVWIGTRYGGVHHLQFENLTLRSIHQYTTRDGLTDNFIYYLHCDKNNTVWIGTQTGLDKIFFRNGKYIIGNVSKNNNFFQTISRIETTGNGSVWALSSEGTVLKIIAGEDKRKVLPSPSLLLTSIKVNNQLHDESATNFLYSQNNFSFSIASPSFIDEKSINYSYLLQGSGNESWSEPSNVSIFNFINLAPGNYTLKLKADFPEMMYPAQMLSYSFTVRPPWWQTWWFKIIPGIILLLITAGIFRFYYRRKLHAQRMILEKKQAIEKERTRIAMDMHDDLGSGLSRIRFLSETISMKQRQQNPLEEDIEKIKEYSYEMIDKMGEIVWALNEKNDTLSDLLSYTRAYAVEYLGEYNINCRIEYPDEVPSLFVSGEFRRNIYLSVKEALCNVVKHASATEVSIRFNINDQLEIFVEDNGKGINMQLEKKQGNGLINMKKRLAEINGSAEIRNENGTVVHFSAPINM